MNISDVPDASTFRGATVDVEVVCTSETMAFTTINSITSHEAAYVLLCVI
jgi:hypothetical protein